TQIPNLMQGKYRHKSPRKPYFFTVQNAVFAMKSAFFTRTMQNYGALSHKNLAFTTQECENRQAAMFGNHRTASTLSLLSMVFHWCKRLRGDAAVCIFCTPNP